MPIQRGAVSALAIPTGWYELEHGVAARLGNEVLHRGVLRCLEVRSRGRGDADVSLKDGPGLVGRDFPDGVVTRAAPTGQAHPAGRPGVEHPGHRPVGRDQPAPPVVLHRNHRVGARSAGLTAMRSQQVGPGHQTGTDKRTHDRVFHVAASAGTVLPRLPSGLAVSAPPARCCGRHGFSLAIDADGYTELRCWSSPDTTPTYAVA